MRIAVISDIHSNIEALTEVLRTAEEDRVVGYLGPDLLGPDWDAGEAERRLILATLEDCEGDKKKAAEVLGISLKTLYNRLNEYKTA